MATKSSSPGLNPITATPAKQARSRKAATQNVDTGRAGSAGGIVLEKETEAKPKSTPVAKSTLAKDAASEEASTASKTTRRKPRKLNKDPSSTTPTASTTAKGSATTAKPIEPPTTTEIEALKSRVRGLEAKVEELYKSGALDRPSGRSPRRRGKGRKGSSQQQVPTLSSIKAKVEEEDDVEEIGHGNGDADQEREEEDVEELVRLEGELEDARQDLAAFRPRNKRPSSNPTYADEDVEDIPRDAPGVESGNPNRHVTLSGSYRIPLPASVSVDDVKHIQSGVSAAQNVARGFLEQRRAAAAAVKSSPTATPTTSTPKAAKPRPTPKSVSSSMEIAEVNQEGGKQSWSEWIGGYSVAISRAVKNIEHEAAVESQRGSAGASGTKKATGTRKGAGSGKTAGGGKRPGVKTKLSGEQVDGLMS